MAGSGTYQVNVGPIRDIAAPFLAGTKTLSGALQGITDDRLNQDKLAQTQLEHADRMKQIELNRAERVSARGRARSDAAARRAELKAEKKAQRDAIKGALTRFNTDAPDSINTGLETQQAVQAPYTADTDEYNKLSGILDTQDNRNINTQATAQVYKNIRDEETAQLQSILGQTAVAKNNLASKGDSIQYDGEGKVIPNAGMQAIDATQFGIEQRKQAVDNEYKTSMYDLLNPSDMAYNAVQGIADQQADVATDSRGVIAEQQSALDTVFDKRIADLNTGIQTDYANDPQVLDKVTNQNRIANELYQSLLMKDVDPAVALSTAQSWLKANPVKEIDKDLVTSLKDERTALLDLMATETKKTETGKLAGSGNGGNDGNGSSLSLKSGETPANAIYKYYKYGDLEGTLDSFASLGRDGLADKETKLRGKLPTGTNFSDKEIAQAMVYGTKAAWPGGDSLTIDTDKSLEYLKKDKAGRAASNEKLTSTLKRKTGTPEQNAKLRSIEQALNDARSPNRTPRDNLRNFSKAADVRPELAKALKVNKLPSKVKETVKQSKKTTKPVQTKGPVSTKTETRPSIKEALTPTKKKVSNKPIESTTKAKDSIKKVLKVSNLPKGNIDRVEALLDEQALEDNSLMFAPAVKATKAAINTTSKAIKTILRGKNIAKASKANKKKIAEELQELLRKADLIKRNSGKVAKLKRGAPKRVPRKLKDLQDLTFTTK